MNKKIRNSYIRVTEALKIIRTDYDEMKEALGSDRVEAMLSAKAGLGTDVHKLCEMLNRSIIENTDFDILVIGRKMDLNVLSYYQSYSKWVESTVSEILYAEQKVYEDDYQYQGTLDLIAILKGDKKPTLIDLKCTANFGPLVKLQLAGYQMAFEKQSKIKIGRKMALRLRPDSYPIAKEYPDIEKDKNLFLYALNLKRGI